MSYNDLQNLVADSAVYMVYANVKLPRCELLTGGCRLSCLFFSLFYFRELTSTFVKLKSLVQRAKEELEERIIELCKEITRLEKIENDAKILR